MKPEVVIIDYGLGNLFNIERAIRYLGSRGCISDDPRIIEEAERIILPGVGAFGEGVASIHKKGLFESIISFAESGRPLLGICLGMQLLMTSSEELGLHNGLNLIAGKVKRFPVTFVSDIGYKIPHMGWKALSPYKNTSWENTILEDIGLGDFMYFVHSYIVYPDSDDSTLAVTVYGKCTFSSVIKKDNIYGCQFHPEKSGEIGLKIINNFLKLKVNTSVHQRG